MTPAFENWFMVFVVVMTLAVVTQLGILAGLLLSMRKLQLKIETLIDRDLHPLLGETRTLLTDGRKTLVNLHATSVNLQATSEDISKFARTQAVRLNDLFGEATERAQVQMARADNIVTDTLGRISRTTEEVHRTVLAPLREIQAVLAGVRTAFEFLGGRRRPRGPVERSTADEEMFI